MQISLEDRSCYGSLRFASSMPFQLHRYLESSLESVLESGPRARKPSDMSTSKSMFPVFSWLIGQQMTLVNWQKSCAFSP